MRKFFKTKVSRKVSAGETTSTQNLDTDKSFRKYLSKNPKKEGEFK